MSTDSTVFPYSPTHFFNNVGNSHQAKYIERYLRELKAKTCILERKYIDKGYLIDYQKFYSRSFSVEEKSTKRIHFFKNEFSEDEFTQALENDNVDHLQESYLGFVVVKPIEGARGNPLIGRTLLKTYPLSVDSRQRFYITKDYSVSIFGIKQNIASIPFQAQDFGVSACATIALWTTIQSLPSHFDVLSYSPSEITELSNEFPSLSRIFPQFGLTLSQMMNCLRLVGLDVEVINAEDSEVITTAIKAYTFMGLPIIGTLKLTKNDVEDLHAVVIVGYQHDKNGAITELYVHDDQIGPYSRVTPDGNFRTWKNEWNERGYSVKLWKLMIPVYHKIRLPFYLIYRHFMLKKQLAEENELSAELVLTTVQEYKNFLLKKQIRDKKKTLQSSLPRFIWIERVSERGNQEPLVDDLFDGTAIRPEKKASIEYSLT